MANEDIDESPAVRGFNEELERWLARFVPAETTIDGGLFPTRFGKGVLGFEYDRFKLADSTAVSPPSTEEFCDRYRELFGHDLRAYK